MTEPTINREDLKYIISRQGKPTKMEQYQNTVTIKLLTPSAISDIMTELASGRLTNYCTAYSRMIDTDADIAALVATRIDRSISDNWKISPATEDPDDKIAALFCEEVLRGIPNVYQRFISIADAIALGYSAHEIDWKYEDGCMVAATRKGGEGRGQC